MDKLLSIGKVIEQVGLSKSMLYKLVRESQFPAPHKISKGASRWSQISVQAWIRSKVEGG